MKNKILASIILAAVILILIFGNFGFHFNINLNDTLYSLTGNKLSVLSNQKNIDIYEEFEHIEQVELNLERGDLKIVSGEKVTLKGNNVDENSYNCTVNNKILVVNEKNTSNMFRGNASYILTIPSTTPLLKITANCSGGTVRFNDVSVNELIFDVEKGSLEGFNLVTSKLNVDASMGSVNLHKIQSKNLNVASGMGSINIDCKIDENNGNITIDSKMGSVNLNVDNDPADFYFDLAKRSSSVNIDGVKAANYKYYNNRRDNSKYGLIVGSGVSSVEICFNNTNKMTQ